MTPDLHVVPPPADPRSPEQTSSSIRVVVADDHELMRFALRALLSTEQQIDVIAEAEQLSLAMRNVRELKPDVLVLDLRMRDGSSIDAIGELREQAPETRVVVMTAEDNPLYAEHALAAGAFGFVLKDQADVELAPAVRAAAEGRRYVSPEIDAKLADLRPDQRQAHGPRGGGAAADRARPHERRSGPHPADLLTHRRVSPGASPRQARSQHARRTGALRAAARLARD
jgi:DNA-binding NarL/FixJ family response regulator